MADEDAAPPSWAWVVGAAAAVLVTQTVCFHLHPVVDLAIGALVLLCAAALRQVVAVRRGARLGRERARQAGEARLAALVRHAADAVWVLDRDGVVRWASPSSRDRLGASGGHVVGQAMHAALGVADAGWVAGLLRRALDAPRVPQRAEGAASPPGGPDAHVEVTLTNLLDEASVAGVVVNLHDVTDRARLERQLVHQAFHDPLTGLANRSLFADRVQHAMARCVRSGHRMVVCMLDLDDFKTVNDGLGHGAGDALLVQVARRIRAQIRDVDTAARLGGDEFAVAAEDLVGQGGAAVFGERLCAAFRAPFELEGREVFVTASVGIAEAEPGDTGETLLRNADAAMYAAKSRGSGSFLVYEASMHAAARDNLELHTLLRTAVDDGDVYVEYQPVHRLASGGVVAVEALARWAPAGRDPVPPGRFVPLAEATGLIVPLGRGVMRRAIDEMARASRRWPQGRAPILSVNVSPRQLQEPGFAEDVRAAVTETGYDPRLLCVELTESVFAQRADAIHGALEALRQMGVKIGIDDFGTGYSSLSYLHRFPLDILKIPREFVERLGRPDGDSMLAQSIVALGAALGLRTIAEGVETEAQVATLRSLGCEWGQGFLFGRPAPLDSVIARAHAVRDGWLAPGAAGANAPGA